MQLQLYRKKKNNVVILHAIFFLRNKKTKSTKARNRVKNELLNKQTVKTKRSLKAYSRITELLINEE